MALDHGDVDSATGPPPSTLETTGEPPRLVWQMDPTELALKASTEMREPSTRENGDGHYLTDDLPDAFCHRLGTTLLLMQLQFSDWVLRRVEKVSFERDRSVSRRITIEFRIPEDTPEFLLANDERYWLVPLSIMRRRTLVNLDLRDEDDRSVSLPGLRLTQQLDGSVLLAAAAAERIPNLERGSPMRKFIQEVIAGTHEQVFKAVQAFERKASQQSTDREYAAQCAMVHRLKSNFTQYLARPVRRFIQETIARKYEQALEEKDTKQPAHLEKAAQKPLFGAMVHRLKSNFTLYVFLPVKRGRHRLLRMSFDEPTEWKPRRADLEGSKATGFIYRPDRPLRCRDLTRAMSAIGWKPTRIRFQVPSAENAASYHFEITAPPGLRIVKANLLAGRPNGPNRHVSTDHVVGHSPTMGLHAVEVPYGSLCRAQVDVRVPTHGWLSTTLVTCWMILIVLVSVVWHILEPAVWSTPQVTNIIALLIATAAGGAALIAQREFGGVAARLVTHMRVLGVIALALPIVVAGFLAYEPPGPQGSPRLDGNDQVAAGLATLLAAAIAVAITVSWCKARDKRRSGMPSPWDMTRDIKRPTYADFDAARKALGFDSPAVAVRSAEGWHERYVWTDGMLKDAIDALKELKNGGGGSDHGVTCHTLQTTCMRSVRCPSK